MKKKSKSNLITLSIVCFFIIGHGIYINTHWVNNEYVFSGAVKTILDPEYSVGLENYWKLQANPLGYSLITALLAFFVGISLWSVRIPSLLGGIAILLAGLAFYRNKNLKNDSLFLLWIATVAFNPLIWMYSGQATADILPVGLVTLAFLCCYLAQGRLWVHLIGGLCFSSAVLVKFNALLLGLGFVYIIFSHEDGKINWNKEKGIHLLFYFLLPGLFLTSYFLAIYHLFGILFIPDEYKTVHSIGHVKNFIPCFTMYMGYLTMLLGLLSFVSLFRLLRVLSLKNFLLLVVVSIVFGVALWDTLIHFSSGEMDYGGHFNALMSKKMVSVIRAGSFIMAFFLFGELIYTAFRERDRFALFLLYALLPYLIIASFSRPAQRYLLFCLPFLTFYLIISLGSRIPKITNWMGWTSVTVFAIITIVSIFYQVKQGTAAERMAQWVISNNYLKETQAGSIVFHAGHHFYNNPDSPKKYTIKKAKIPPKNLIHKESVILFGREILTHYLVRQNP